jgi:hypothetical protein
MAQGGDGQSVMGRVCIGAPPRRRSAAAAGLGMPPEAIALLLFFVGVAFVVGAVAAYAVGPRRPWAAILPILGAFGSLYVVGHRIGLSLGPQVNLFGFEVAIVWDVAVAIVAAVVVAVLQRAARQLRSAPA